MKLFLFAVAWLASGVCLIAVCRVLSRLIYPKMIGWNAVVAAFPSRSVETVADAYMGRGGTVGSFRFGSSGGYNIFGKRGGTFDISITEQGLAVTADFSPRAPILVRWEDIRAISVGDSSLAIVVNYVKPIQFYLPVAALASLSKRIPGDKFHKAVSAFEMAKVHAGDKARFLWK